jgi:hypothetical protein
MSIENTLRYNQTKQLLTRIDNLKSKGEQFIRTISKSLNQLYPDHFKESNTTGTRLHLKFFGLTLLVRVEIVIDQDKPGRVRTYVCDEATPPLLQSLEFEYAFDDLGNVDRTMTFEQAAEKFGPELIKHLRSKKIALLL